MEEKVKEEGRRVWEMVRGKQERLETSVYAKPLKVIIYRFSKARDQTFNGGGG